MKQGDLVILSTEVYSDKASSGPYKVLKDFLFKDIVPLVTVQQNHPWREKPGPDDVIHWLRFNGYLEDVECTEVHLGSYGDIDVTGVTE